MEGCPFILGNDKGTEQYYHFCKGTSACQLIQDKRICDGRFNCFDRQVVFDCSSAFLVADAEPHGEAAGDVVRHVAAEDHRGQVVRTLSPHGPAGKGETREK